MSEYFTEEFLDPIRDELRKSAAKQGKDLPDDLLEKILNIESKKVLDEAGKKCVQVSMEYFENLGAE